jgi:tetratricopeptide (TPR) repeat protein
VLLDALVVLYRTHNADRRALSGTKEFKSMEYLISKTAYPTLTRIRYQSRYGVSLFQGGKTEKGLQHLEISLGDATMFMSGKDIGNILFALVNAKLELYAQSSNGDLKKEILDLIESGIRYFENESEDSRNNWRCIYLDKKTCCYLGLNSNGKVIDGVSVSEQDLENAKTCLLEAEQLDSVMDVRRRMHFYTAKYKYHKHKNQPKIADGFLEEALELAKKGGFHHDEKILMQQCTTVEISSHKKPMEHTTGSDVIPEANAVFRNYDVDTKDLDKKALDNIARALHIDTFVNLTKKEPTEN